MMPKNDNTQLEQLF